MMRDHLNVIGREGAMGFRGLSAIRALASGGSAGSRRAALGALLGAAAAVPAVATAKTSAGPGATGGCRSERNRPGYCPCRSDDQCAGGRCNGRTCAPNDTERAALRRTTSLPWGREDGGRSLGETGVSPKGKKPPIGIHKIYYNPNCDPDPAPVCYVVCPLGYQAIGGGLLDLSANAMPLIDYPDDSYYDVWWAAAFSLDTNNAEITPYAVCLRK